MIRPTGAIALTPEMHAIARNIMSESLGRMDDLMRQVPQGEWSARDLWDPGVLHLRHEAGAVASISETLGAPVLPLGVNVHDIELTLGRDGLVNALPSYQRISDVAHRYLNSLNG